MGPPLSAPSPASSGTRTSEPTTTAISTTTHTTTKGSRFERVQLAHLTSGKVRDIYEIDESHLLFVTSDRMSAFDVVMAEPIPDKGRVLTAVTDFWLSQLADVAPNHLVSLEVPEGIAAPDIAADLEGRVMVVRRAEMLPVECIVRGYLSGSAWAEYRRTQTMHGSTLPAGLRQSERLPEPVFTPSTKAAEGHDREHFVRRGGRSGGGGAGGRGEAASPCPPTSGPLTLQRREA